MLSSLFLFIRLRSKFFKILAVVILIGGSILGLYGKGFYDGKHSEIRKQIEAERQAQEKRERIEREVTTLPDDELDRRLAKWMRD